MADSAALINVVVIGQVEHRYLDDVRLAAVPESWATDFTIRHDPSDARLEEVLAERIPQVVVSFGSLEDFPKLAAAQLEIRRRWIHFDEAPQPQALAWEIMSVVADVVRNERFAEIPLVSVFTPTYHTGSRIYRAYNSLTEQAYNNWEWVVYDDSADLETFELLVKIAETDHRVKPFRSWRNCGVIGEVKRRATGLCSGSILVELDHDDRLMPNCLSDVVAAFAAMPDCGFAYTDWAEVLDDGANAWHGEHFAFGFGSYRREVDDGREYLVANAPPINAKTIRHIVGVPNHARAWRRAALDTAGGFSGDLHVADDYELLIRTFLTTRMVHVHRWGYVQTISRDGQNSHLRRNGEIQRLVHFLRGRYEKAIHDRFIELGVDDFIWTTDGLDWDLVPPDPVPHVTNLWPPIGQGPTP